MCNVVMSERKWYLSALLLPLLIIGFISEALAKQAWRNVTPSLASQAKVIAAHNVSKKFSPGAATSVAPVSKLGPVLTLSEAILLALRHNPDISNATIDRIVQKYQLRLAEWHYQWQYHANGYMNYTHTQTNIGQPANSAIYDVTLEANKQLYSGTRVTVNLDQQSTGVGYVPTATLSLQQPLLRGARRSIVLQELARANDQELLNQLAMRRVVSQVISQVIFDYRGLIQANNNVVVAKKSLQDAERSYENTAVQIRLGKIPRMESVTQQAQVASLRLQLAQAVNSRYRQQQQFLQTLGLDATIKIEVPNDVDLVNIKIPDLQQTIHFALDNNMEFIALKIRQREGQRQLDKANDDKRWQLDLTANARISRAVLPRPEALSPSLLNDTNHNESFGLRLQIPIDDVSLAANLATAKVNLLKQKTDFARQQRQLIADIQNLVTDLTSQQQQLALATQSVQLKEKDYELQSKKLQLGKGAAIEVTQSQNNLIAAKNQLINNKIQFMNTLTTLSVKLDTILNDWKIQLRY